MICNYSMSHPADVHNDVVGTAWHQQMAGSGRHTERMQRGRVQRVGQLYELPVLPNPIHEAALFAAEVERDAPLYRRSVARSAVEGAVVGAALAYAWRHRR
jgi:hypothetical protein